mmetsp:Transcript_29155/g.28795  ORF Transcript_29155/g.28795 Transcript_29155/m.28795 type:complete len:92 (+) Transcript_29155:103-378(+)
MIRSYLICFQQKDPRLSVTQLSHLSAIKMLGKLSMLYLHQRLNKLIRPNIVKMDQKAVSRIMERIKNEEMLDTMHQMWIQEQRQHLRNSLK